MFTPPRHTTPDRRLENPMKKIRREVPSTLQSKPLYPFNPLPQHAKIIAERRNHPRFKRDCANVKFYAIDNIPTKCASDLWWRENETSDTRNYKKLPNGVSVKLFRFSIKESGELVCGPNDVGEKYSHGAMVDYDDVFAVGEFGADKQGNILYVSNRTGHYCVPPESLSERVYPYLIDVLGYTLEQIQAFYEGTYTHGEIIDGATVIAYSCNPVGETFVYPSTGRIENFGQTTSSNQAAVNVSPPASPKSPSFSAFYQNGVYQTSSYANFSSSSSWVYSTP